MKYTFIYSLKNVKMYKIHKTLRHPKTPLSTLLTGSKSCLWGKYLIKDIITATILLAFGYVFYIGLLAIFNQ